jgi:stage III sporulation protein SpoIIIAA
MQIKKDLDQLLGILPPSFEAKIQKHSKKQALVEIILDLGRRPEARFPTHAEYLSPKLVTWQDLDYSIKSLSQFADDNRAGIEKTLHRISCIRNREGLIIGLTCRVGRAIYGTINIIRDLLESKKSILILGCPGVGKTTMIREIARVIANEMEKRVVIIDTSNEIAGDSDIPHVGIGRARRMQVSHSNLQHNVMIEAVENHMPEVIIIDEIGTELEALAAQTIAERGVQLIGTAHGTFLGSLIKNPTLSDLVGGIECVTLSDEEARRRSSQKTILERKNLPAFQIAIELNTRNSWTIHEQVENSIDFLLQGLQPKLQVRNIENLSLTKILLSKYIPNDSPSIIQETANKNWRNKLVKISNSDNMILQESLIKKTNIFGRIKFKSRDFLNLKIDKDNFKQKKSRSFYYVYLYSVSTYNFLNLSKLLKVSLVITEQLEKTDYIIGLKSHLKNNKKILKFALNHKIDILYLTQNNITEMNQTLLDQKNFHIE